MIKGYPEGSDLTIMDTRYTYPKKDDKGKWSKGSMTIVAKDNVTNEKIIETIDNPTYEYYIAKDDVYIDHNQFFIEKENTTKITVPYSELEKDIAERTNNLKMHYDNIKNGNRYANKIVHTHPKVFMSDTHIEDHYRYRFNKLYSNNINPITKAFFDIEVDTINMKGDFPEPGECPINAISLINEENNTVYVLLLENKDNPQIEEFKQSINDKFIEELNDFITDTVGGWKQARRLDVDKLKFEFFFYDEDEEIKLIQDLFIILNHLKPDFVLVWNMSFDIPYIIERIKKLGYNPEDIMCHKDFRDRTVKYFIDERVFNEFAERGDFATISSYSIFLDQMIQFASRRKGQSAFPSFKLDDIGNIIAKVKKLNYKHITTDLAKLPYLNYKIFVLYNIIDTLVQKCIEKKTGDVDYVFSKCIANNTRYNKIHRQTVYLANRGALEFEENDNVIICNNNNRQNPKPPKFPGAFVADPTKVSNYAKIKINGIPIEVFDNLDDFDYARLYPSMMQEFNMAPNTQKGMVVIPDKIHDKEHDKDDTYNRGGAFLEDLQSHVYLEFCHRWFAFPCYLQLYKDIIEYYTNNKNSVRPLRNTTPDGKRTVVHFHKKDLLINPITFDERFIKAVSFYKKRPEYVFKKNEV